MVGLTGSAAAARDLGFALHSPICCQLACFYFPCGRVFGPPVCKACGEFDDGVLKVTVSSVRIDATGKAAIDWSDTLNGTARSKGSTVTLPAALNVANSYLIWSEVQYSYKPVIGYVVSGTLALKDQIYMRPRLSDSVTRDTFKNRLTESVAPSSYLIFSIAKRDVTFFSEPVPISFL